MGSLTGLPILKSTVGECLTSGQPRRLAQQPDAVAASANPADRAGGIRSTANPADRSRGVRSTTHPAGGAGGIRPAADPTDRSRGIPRTNAANRSGGIWSSSHDASSSLVLFRGEVLLELLDHFGSDLYALHQNAAGIHDSLAEIGDPQILP
jgi:hypothetical protein